MEEKAMPVCEKLSEKQLFYTFQCYRLSKEPDLKDRVVRHFMPVAEREARKALRSAPQDMDRQDLVSYAILGMIEALEHYDPDRNPNMEGYVAAWIKGSLHKGIRTFLGKGRIRSKEGCSPLVFLSVEGQGKDLIENMADPVDPMEEADDRILQRERTGELAEAMARLDPFRRDIIWQHYFQDKSLRQISRENHCSHSWICRQHQQALTELRRMVRLSTEQ